MMSTRMGVFFSLLLLLLLTAGCGDKSAALQTGVRRQILLKTQDGFIINPGCVKDLSDEQKKNKDAIHSCGVNMAVASSPSSGKGIRRNYGYGNGYGYGYGNDNSYLAWLLSALPQAQVCQYLGYQDPNCYQYLGTTQDPSASQCNQYVSYLSQGYYTGIPNSNCGAPWGGTPVLQLDQSTVSSAGATPTTSSSVILDQYGQLTVTASSAGNVYMNQVVGSIDQNTMQTVLQYAQAAAGSQTTQSGTANTTTTTAAVTTRILRDMGATTLYQADTNGLLLISANPYGYQLAQWFVPKVMAYLR